ncbi:MAG: MMPL family transporter [Solirubrobacteraceae bacterium]|nr:MMPL family transporter [Solirubrobacteraceae bacterium]
MSRPLHALAALAATRPRLVLAVCIALTLVGAGLALRLEPDASNETLVGDSSPTAQATRDLAQQFGEDSVIVMVRGDLNRIVLTDNLTKLIGLEGCLAGNVPSGARPTGGSVSPCGHLAEDKPVKVVIGPGTFINESVRQLQEGFAERTKGQSERAAKAANAARQLALKQGRSKAEADQLAEKAKQLVQAEYIRDALQLAVRYGLTGIPNLGDPTFISQLVFDPQRPAGTPKSRFAYLFPSKQAALIQVRLKPGLSDQEQRDAIDEIRAATEMPDFALDQASYAVTGAPVVVNDLTDEISRSLVILLLAAVLVMAATLALVFNSRLRLLPLAVALGAAAITFGALSLAGQSLTIAAIAVLPVLIGLAVDYAIQLQARVEEVRRRDGLAAAPAAKRAAALGAPTVATAAAATIAGFLVLLLSPVPMVRGFGVLLIVGIVVAFVLALAGGTAALVLADRPARRARGRLGTSLGAALRGAGALLRDNRPVRALRRGASRVGTGAVGLATRRPGRVLVVAAVLAVGGWAADTQLKVQTDILELVPQDQDAVANLRDLQQKTGVAGQVDVLVTGDNVGRASTITWLGELQKKVLDRYGYTTARGCGKAEICPAFSLPDLFSTQDGKLTQKRTDALLDAIPPYFSQSVITPDRRAATLSFGLKLMPLDRQQEVLEELRRGLENPPPGVTARLAGLPVLAAEANDKISGHGRRVLTLIAGLLAVALILLIALRSAKRALVPLIPIVLATGWSALVLFVLRIELNPLSVVLGALVIAISTEFSVLLSERYRSERDKGRSVGEALDRAYGSTGAAVAASGVTVIAGFAVLILSGFPMIRNFGLVCVIDLTVSLLGVLFVLPAALVWSEGGLRVRSPRPSGSREPANSAA